MNAGNVAAKRKRLSWCCDIQYPGKESVRFGNVYTTGFDKDEARRLLVAAVGQALPDGWKMGWWGRGELTFESQEEA